MHLEDANRVCLVLLKTRPRSIVQRGCLLNSFRRSYIIVFVRRSALQEIFFFALVDTTIGACSAVTFVIAPAGTHPPLSMYHVGMADIKRMRNLPRCFFKTFVHCQPSRAPSTLCPPQASCLRGDFLVEVTTAHALFLVRFSFRADCTVSNMHMINHVWRVIRGAP